ncbi:helix-turn-helix transcriptional regulator [candidate division FCPU426 bacterium]|nr:helix-turn-helix transcriptional regulator [candidate division FCPU426 bacterium]
MNYQFGDKIREVRERRQKTIRAVAQEAGVSQSLISQIERNKISPAIDTLLKIIDVLEIDLDYIFRDFKKERIVNLVRVQDRKRAVMGGVAYAQLSHTASSTEEHAIEAYFLEIPPGGKSGDEEYGHIGKELGVIIKGRCECLVGNQVYTLNEGDSISFPAEVPHQLRNCGKQTLRAFWVVTPPKRMLGRK